MSLIIVAAALASTLSGSSATTAPTAAKAALTASESDSVKAAETWTELLDAQNWEQSWRTAGTVFKAQLTEAQWASQVAALRQTMGAPSSRKLENVKTTTSLPGAPEGQYEIVQFQTDFANKGGATETVVLARQNSDWKVNGYFIR